MLFLDEKTCIDFLESKGYYTYKLFDTSMIPTNPLELVKYFFSKFRSMYNIDYMSILWKSETHYAKNLIIQMSQTGSIKDKVAMSKCKYIIDTIYENIDIFDKYYKFNTLKMLAAESGYWVIEKCFSLDNNKINERTGYSQKEYDNLYGAYEKMVEEKVNLDKIKIELNKILGI